MNNQTNKADWQEYERRKALIHDGLSNEEYEKEIKKIATELGL